jgi:hypothetical protein
MNRVGSSLVPCAFGSHATRRSSMESRKEEGWYGKRGSAVGQGFGTFYIPTRRDDAIVRGLQFFLYQYNNRLIRVIAGVQPERLSLASLAGDCRELRESVWAKIEIDSRSSRTHAGAGC